jgi:phospholipase/lecithinase/hemolysin
MNDLAVPSADEQARTYLAASHPTIDYNSTLFTVLAGGNDIFFNPNITGLQSAAAIFNIVAELQGAGAKHFLLPNYPDLSQIPYSTFVDDVATKDKLQNWSSAQAVAIQSLCEKLPSCTSVDLADLFQHFYFYGEPTTYGFDTYGAYGSCLVGAYGETTDVTICVDPDKRVFWYV